MSISCEVVDGDKYRRTLTRHLGFSYANRIENIRLLSLICREIIEKGGIVILAAINPYEIARAHNRQLGDFVKTIWVRCELPILINRDTKGLYRRALLPNGDPEKLSGFTGIDDPYEEPVSPDMIIDTATETSENNIDRLVNFILNNR